MLKPEHRSLLQAYAAGINAYVKGIPILPLEFWKMGANFKEWMPKDSLMIFKLFSFEFSGNWKQTVLRTIIKEKLGKKWAERIVPTDDKVLENLSVIEPQEARGTLYKKTPITPKRAEEALRPTALIEGPAITMPFSNSWVLDGNYTSTHKPILATDLGFEKQMPGVFYLASLRFPDDSVVVGATVPGIPAILVGRNRHLAWSISNSGLEAIDPFKITIDYEKALYLCNGIWNTLNKREVIINVKNEESIIHTVYYMTHGPIIQPFESSDDAPKIFTVTPPPKGLNSPIGLLWAGFEENDSSFELMMDLGSVKDKVEFKSSMLKLRGFSASFLLATDKGEIGYWATGEVPKRPSIEDSLYVRDVREPLSIGDKTEFYNTEANPHILNPKKGFIVDCNNKISQSNYFSGIGSALPGNARASRAYEIIKSKIASNETFSMETMKRMQGDLYDVFANRTLHSLLKLVDKYKEIVLGKGTEQFAIVSHLTGILQGWDSDMVGNDKRALIYNIWFDTLLNAVLRKHFNEKEIEVIKTSPNLENFLGEMIKSWEKDQDLDNEACSAPINAKYPCAYLAITSLIDAHAYIVETLGKNEKNWQWAYINEQDYYHPVYSDTWLGYMFHKKAHVGVLFLN